MKAGTKLLKQKRMGVLGTPTICLTLKIWNGQYRHESLAYGGLAEASGGLAEASVGLAEASGGLAEASRVLAEASGVWGAS